VNGVIVEIRWMEEEEKFCHLRKGGDLKRLNKYWAGLRT